jgi:hypothetical protein
MNLSATITRILAASRRGGRWRVRAFLLLFVSGALLSCSSNHWVEFAPADGAFSVSVPALPAKKEFEQELPTMHLKLVQYVITTNEITFTVHYTDYPPTLVATNTPDAVLDPGIKKMFGANPSARKESRNAVWRGYPARTFNMDDPSTGYSVVGRSCLVGSRLYVIQVVRPTRIAAQQEIKWFMESFRLKN